MVRMVKCGNCVSCDPGITKSDIGHCLDKNRIPVRKNKPRRCLSFAWARPQFQEAVRRANEPKLNKFMDVFTVSKSIHIIGK